MLRLFTRILAVVAALQISGGHWTVLQSVAWVGMVVSYTQADDSLATAVEKTFDGQHPCNLCEVVKDGREADREQDLQKQEHLLLKYAQQHEMQIDDFIQVEISSRRNPRERRIDELLARLHNSDVLLIAELSRLGRNMFEVINLINQLSADGVKLIFVRQPELSTAGPHGKLLLAIYSYFAEVEREFISMRTRQGLAAARAQGKQLGRPKGSRDKERERDSLDRSR